MSHPDPSVTAVVLLTTAPRRLADVLGDAHPELGARAGADPAIGDRADLALTLNGHDVRFAVGPRVASPGFELAVSESLVRPRAEAAASAHRGTVTVSATVGAGVDALAAHDLVSNLAAGVLGREDAGAVWLPHQGQVTTDVLFTGELDRRPAHTWFRVVAMSLDTAAGTSHAFTGGLDALGGTDVQWSGTTAAPRDAWTALRAGVADLLEAGTVPAAGGRIELGGTPYALAPGTDLFGRGSVLDVVAVTPAAASGGRRRRWFGRG